MENTLSVKRGPAVPKMQMIINYFKRLPIPYYACCLSPLLNLGGCAYIDLILIESRCTCSIFTKPLYLYFLIGSMRAIVIARYLASVGVRPQSLQMAYPSGPLGE